MYRTYVLNPLLLARFNSMSDKNYGVVGHKEISPNFYQVKDMSKRFFDDEAVGELFAEGCTNKEFEEASI